MSTYYRPRLQGFRGYGAVTDYGAPAAGGFTVGANGAVLTQAFVVPGAMPGEVPDPGPEFALGSHRAPPASVAAFSTALMAARSNALVQADPLQALIKSGGLQLQTWEGYAASCRNAGGEPVKQANGDMQCVGPAGEVTLGAGFGTQSGNAPVAGGGGSAIGGSGGGSGGSTGADFVNTCKQLGGTYSTGPTCTLADGTVIGTCVDGSLYYRTPTGQAYDLYGGTLPAGCLSGAAAGGGAGVAMLGGVALLALLLLR